jgi:predicted amidophosphoribosyltransferase
MDRCPNCRARLDGSDQCRRCGLELKLLQATDRACDAAVARAIRRLAADDRTGAIQDLKQARALSGGAFVSALLAFARSTPSRESAPDITAGPLVPERRATEAASQPLVEREPLDPESGDGRGDLA